jgi:hypothetical protein
MSASANPLVSEEHSYGTQQGRERPQSIARRITQDDAIGAESFMASVHEHRSPYNFAYLVEIFGRQFTRTLVDAWSVEFVNDQPATTVKRASILKKFLKDLARLAARDETSVQRVVYEALSGRRALQVDSRAFHDVTAAFCDRLHKRDDQSIVRSASTRTRNNLINGLSSVLNHLSKHNVFPIGHRLRSIPVGPFEPRTLTFAEISIAGPMDCSDPRKAFLVLLRDPALSQMLNIPTDGVLTMSVATLTESWMKVMSLRVDALRACAVADLEEEFKVFEEGSALRQRTDLPPRDVILDALNAWSSRAGIDALLEPLENGKWGILPGSPEQRLLGLLVTVMSQDYESNFNVRDLDWRLARAMCLCGGLGQITRRFEATPAAYTAAQTIVLIDTLFNPSVCDRLAADLLPMPKGGQRQMQICTVEAMKRRANNKFVTAKLIDDEVSQIDIGRGDRKRSGVWAIRMWLAMSKPIRDRAKTEGQGLEKYLWILPRGGNKYRGLICRPDNTTAWAWWNNFKEKHRDDPLIGRLPIDRNMIRISCLQIRSGPTATSSRLMQILAQHASSRTTSSYARTSVMDAVLAEQIRIFQDLLQGAAGYRISEMAGILNLTEDEVLTRRNLALQTGLGFFCADPIAGTRPGTRIGEQCDRLEDCPVCPLRKFVPNPEALKALWLWGKALRDQCDHWMASNPERWKTIWLPWLAIVTVTEEKLNGGRFRVQFERAVAIASKQLAAGKLQVPVLW